MTREKGGEDFIGKKAAEEVFERHNEIHCTNCRGSFVVETLQDRESWRCPHCRKLNPSLYNLFVIMGAALSAGILANLILLVVYVRALGRDINIVFMMWGAAQTLVTGYAVIAIFGDKHSYGLKPLRYLVPVVFVSAAASVYTYQVSMTAVNAAIAGVVFAAAGLFFGYAFYLSARMVTPHRPEESIVRPLYSTISIALNVLLLTLLTTVAVKYTKLLPGNSTLNFGPAGDDRVEVAELDDVKKEVEKTTLDSPDVSLPPLDPNLLDAPALEFKPEMKIVDSPTKYVVAPEEKGVKPTATKEAKESYEQRRKRARALREYGGTDTTEYAVLMALEWLRKHQNRDGSWGDGAAKPSMTGLALLCFLGHGEDQASETYGEVVRSAINWLVSEQDELGYFADTHRGYQHGIVTYALAEAYGVCQLADLEPVVSKAVQRIIEGQTVDGSWVYGYAQDVGGRTTDMSVSGWQIQALKAAHSAGIRDERLAETLRKASAYLQDSYSSKNQTFGYNGQGVGWEQEYAMTGTGTLCMEFLGKYDAPEVKATLAQMKSNYSFDWKETEGGRSKFPLYAWYYGTQAFYQSADSPRANVYWRFWNPRMQKTLLTKQNRDGSWPLPEKSNAMASLGSKRNTDVWATSFCCLMLEVYYRYLPTYRLARF